MCQKWSLIFHKIAVVSLIILTALIEFLELYEYSKDVIELVERPHFATCVVNFITNGFLIGFSIVAICGFIYEQITILKTFLVAIVLCCFTKMVVWVVCGNYLDNVDPHFDHRLFQLGMVLALMNLYFSSRLCMRIYDRQRE